MKNSYFQITAKKTLALVIVLASFFLIYFIFLKKSYLERTLLSIAVSAPTGYSEYKASDIFSHQWNKVCFVPPELFKSDQLADNDLNDYLHRNHIEFGENRWGVVFLGEVNQFFIITRGQGSDYPSLFDLRNFPGLNFSICQNRQDAYISILKKERTYFFLKG